MLVVIPTSGAEALDKSVAAFRAQFPNATDEDADDVRQQLLDALLKYGHIPEFQIEITNTAESTDGSQRA